MTNLKKPATITVALICFAAGMNAQAQPGSFNLNGCSSLPGYSALKTALESAVSTETSGLNNQMWATIVDRDGIVCAVAFSGVSRGAQCAGQPGDLRAESQYGKLLQPGCLLEQRWFRSAEGAGPVHGESLLGRSTRG